MVGPLEVARTSDADRVHRPGPAVESAPPGAQNRPVTTNFMFPQTSGTPARAQVSRLNGPELPVKNLTIVFLTLMGRGLRLAQT